MPINHATSIISYVSVTCFCHHLVFWLFLFHIRKRAGKAAQTFILARFILSVGGGGGGGGGTPEKVGREGSELLQIPTVI